jgi:uncharacterized protein YigE (DUF2233 family)
VNKKTVVFLVIAFAIAFIFIKRGKFSNDGAKSEDTPTPTTDMQEVREEDLITYDEYSLSVAEIKVDDNNSVGLIPNFEEELQAEEIAQIHNCTNIVNAGFYTEDRKPIGLFVTEKGVFSSYQNNKTLNGVLSIGETGNVAISYNEPLTPRIAVQSGPIIIFNGEITDLKLQRDFYARRMVAALDTKNNLYFFAVYNPESTIQGPNLIDLGDTIKIYSVKNDIVIDSAINLDGGAASAFFSDSVTLEELVPVGSVFCIN